MAFDPTQPTWLGGLVAILFYIVQILNRKAKQMTPGTVEYTEKQFALLKGSIKELRDFSEEQFGKQDAKIDSLTTSNRHRRNEITELDYKLRKLERRLDEGSGA